MDGCREKTVLIALLVTSATEDAVPVDDGASKNKIEVTGWFGLTAWA